MTTGEGVLKTAVSRAPTAGPCASFIILINSYGISTVPVQTNLISERKKLKSEIIIPKETQ